MLAYFGFPKAHRVKIHSMNTLERARCEHQTSPTEPRDLNVIIG
ncbi:hypothetical protein ACZ87_00841 [Candidatus Erwinia dacicola]|uniref:Uncharacterized protein n=1 Tax=Candidatus Erwinia dacicola TaxID=252393 RepID=A0A328TQ13_9GAMM|nr:hypothetical protein ACZ87_00841 [Candidatus Erwinia dacicola]